MQLNAASTMQRGSVHVLYCRPDGVDLSISRTGDVAAELHPQEALGLPSHCFWGPNPRPAAAVARSTVPLASTSVRRRRHSWVASRLTGLVDAPGMCAVSAFPYLIPRPLFLSSTSPMPATTLPTPTAALAAVKLFELDLRRSYWLFALGLAAVGVGYLPISFKPPAGTGFFSFLMFFLETISTGCCAEYATAFLVATLLVPSVSSPALTEMRWTMRCMTWLYCGHSAMNRSYDAWRRRSSSSDSEFFIAIVASVLRALLVTQGSCVAL